MDRQVGPMLPERRHRVCTVETVAHRDSHLGALELGVRLGRGPTDEAHQRAKTALDLRHEHVHSLHVVPVEPCLDAVGE